MTQGPTTSTLLLTLLGGSEYLKRLLSHRRCSRCFLFTLHDSFGCTYPTVQSFLLAFFWRRKSVEGTSQPHITGWVQTRPGLWTKPVMDTVSTVRSEVSVVVGCLEGRVRVEPSLSVDYRSRRPNPIQWVVFTRPGTVSCALRRDSRTVHPGLSTSP